MLKVYEEMNEEEKLAFVVEVFRLYKFGAACIMTSARNAGESEKGFPYIEVETPNGHISTHLCDALTILYEASTERYMQQLIRTSALKNEPIIDNIEIIRVIHDSMHDAFYLGIAAASLLELDFNGIENTLENFGNSEV